ncbi:MAG: thioredoxin family protein, partial [Cyclobacteriaceae bacterium]|nr:thioredoxin family protein [Cyclobacteriaceae bacterium]
MSLTPSNMLPLGTIAPDFTLLDTVSDRKLTLSELKSDSATLVMFICNHCPYVKHVKEELTNIANEYMQDGVVVVAINSNDAENYPEDAPEYMKEDAKKFRYPFPYFYDETQEIARAYQAACTP